MTANTVAVFTVRAVPGVVPAGSSTSALTRCLARSLRDPTTGVCTRHSGRSGVVSAHSDMATSRRREDQSAPKASLNAV
ncbi:hypothetical protein [Embleya sp. NPDC020886]|uniref:hypothetical protein n=1 Tax=Embleya sp. NPDC020886 TaxID=3363980 RepID=UPI0037B0484A